MAETHMTILDEYEIIEQISEGGFGRIFKARHKALEELACLKQNITPSTEHVELLRQEAKILWKLDEYHSIPSAKGFCQLDGTNAVLVMRYIDGKTLESIVAKNGRLHPEDAAWITERLLGALYYAHANGIIHSDVKPGNVIVEPRKRDIKLIDWGLSVYKPTSTTRPVGSTPAYAAPEIIDRKPPIPETDIYGAGLVLLYALGGEDAVMNKRFPGDAPKPLAEFGQSLLLYDPTQRPNWNKINIIGRLSDIREDAFGRRHVA
ncbi:TPA: serine/threonine protein kinase [Candidatus Woesearchaeota archaeon]|nr:serine/threonine protein kinase [Candidatus Woesearchaeota archaeon]